MNDRKLETLYKTSTQALTRKQIAQATDSTESEVRTIEENALRKLSSNVKPQAVSIKRLCKLSDAEFSLEVDNKLSLSQLRQAAADKNFDMLQEERQQQILTIIKIADGIIPEHELWQYLDGQKTFGRVLEVMPNRQYRRVCAYFELNNNYYTLCGIVKLPQISRQSYIKSARIALRFTSEYGVFEFAR